MKQISNKEYDAYIKRERHELGRVQVLWYKDLGAELADFKEPGNYPRLQFVKIF